MLIENCKVQTGWHSPTPLRLHDFRDARTLKVGKSEERCETDGII